MFTRLSHAVYTLFTRCLHAVYTLFTRDSAAVLQLFNTGSTAFQAPFRGTLPTLYGHLDAQIALNLTVFTRSLKTDSQRGLQCDLAALLTQLLRRQNPTPHSLATYGDLTDPEGCTGGQ